MITFIASVIRPKWGGSFCFIWLLFAIFLGVFLQSMQWLPHLV